MRAKEKEKEKEEEHTDSYDVEYSLQSLKGGWKDTKGSYYEVIVKNDVVEITTTRPAGKVIKTRSLVHWDTTESDWIVWGRSGARNQYWLSELSSEFIYWEREGSAAFTWQRVSGPPESECSDSNEPEEEDTVTFEQQVGSHRVRAARGQERRQLRQQLRDQRRAWEEKEYEEGQEEEEEQDEAGQSDLFAEEQDEGEAEEPEQEEDAEEKEEEIKGNGAAEDRAPPDVLTKMTGISERSAASAARRRQAEAVAAAAASEPTALEALMAASAPVTAAAPRYTYQVKKASDDPREVEARLLTALREGGASVDGSAPVCTPAATMAQPAQSSTNLACGIPESCDQPGAYLGHLESVVHSFLGGGGHCQGGDPIVDHEILMGRLVGGQGLPIYPDSTMGSHPPSWAMDPRHVSNMVQEQLEYYFSDNNLFNDSYLKSFMMPEEGWVSLMLVQSFPRMRVLGADLFALRQAAMACNTLEIDGAGLFVRIEDQHRRRRWTPRPYI